MVIVGALSQRASALRARVASTSAWFGPLELAVALGAALSAVAGTIGALWIVPAYLVGRPQKGTGKEERA